MIELHLDQEETFVLEKMLEECIMGVHAEIVRTERSEYRGMLKTRETLLKKILAQVHAQVQESLRSN